MVGPVTEHQHSDGSCFSKWVNYPDLAGKVAVVTGGSRGIGAATAVALAANGVSVAVVGRDERALTAVAWGSPGRPDTDLCCFLVMQRLFVLSG